MCYGDVPYTYCRLHVMSYQNLSAMRCQPLNVSECYRIRFLAIYVFSSSPGTQQPPLFHRPGFFSSLLASYARMRFMIDLNSRVFWFLLCCKFVPGFPNVDDVVWLNTVAAFRSFVIYIHVYISACTIDDCVFEATKQCKGTLRSVVSVEYDLWGLA
jgi:hypothetical protein